MDRAPTVTAFEERAGGRKATGAGTVPPGPMELPGPCLRCPPQIAVAVFREETEPFGITPVQFSAPDTVHRRPLLDQLTLARSIGFDTSTIAGVGDRPERHGLIADHAPSDDRRVRRLAFGPTAKRCSTR